MIEIKTYWSKENPPYGAFDDYVIIESINENKRILIRPEEFKFLHLSYLKIGKMENQNIFKYLRNGMNALDLMILMKQVLKF